MIVVAGKNNIAVHALNSLADHLGSNSIIALPNKNDSGVDGWQRSLRRAAQIRQVRLATPESLENTPITILVSLEYDRLLNPARFPGARLYNFHFSCLPSYKGMYTSVWPVLYGDDESGVTIHAIEQGIDTGDIYDQCRFKILRNDRSRDLYRKYLYNGSALFERKIKAILANSLECTPQPPEGSSYYPKEAIDFSKIKIDLRCTAWQLQRQLYAYSFREYQLPHILGRPIVEIDITDRKSRYKPGTVLNDSGVSITICSIDYDVILYTDRIEEILTRLQTCHSRELPWLMKHVAGIHDRNGRGWSPIIVAAYHGNLGVVDYLLTEGADPNDQNYKGTTVLMYAKEYALRSRNKDVFNLLLEAGADPYAKDFGGKTLADYLTNQEACYLGL